MNLIESVITCFKKSFTFQGRASRSEFWYFILFQFMLNLKIITLASMLKKPELEIITSLTTLIFSPASISVAVRRLHDVNRSGWWYWLPLTIIGIFPLLYWFVKSSDKNRNEYGLPPSNN